MTSPAIRMTVIWVIVHFYFGYSETKTWFDAKQVCDANRGSLPEVRNDEEFEELKRVYTDMRELFWIGGRFVEADGEWVWGSDNQRVDIARYKTPRYDMDADFCLMQLEDGFIDHDCNSDRAYRVVCDFP